MAEWIIAVAAATAVAAAAQRLGALDRAGAGAAALVGAVVLGFAGLGPAVTLVFFFVSSSALSALPGAGERSRRGARQVLANGSLAALAAAFYGVHPTAGVAFLGALAAATADTWATEVGLRLAPAPRSVLTFKPQPPGTSGAVSLPGTVAAAAGALAVAGLGVWWMSQVEARGLTAVAAAGFLASLLDSVLGAGVQAAYHCPRCGARPEVARHRGCASRALRVSGVPGMDNDIVNWITTLAGAVLAVVLQQAAMRG